MRKTIIAIGIAVFLLGILHLLTISDPPTRKLHPENFIQFSLEIYTQNHTPPPEMQFPWGPTVPVPAREAQQAVDLIEAFEGAMVRQQRALAWHKISLGVLLAVLGVILVKSNRNRPNLSNKPLHADAAARRR